jgi:DNA/RNA-binding domain of Phe-tRNA-synthetase-like protein
VLVRVAPDLASIIRLGVLVMTGAANRENDAALTAHLAAAASAARVAAPADPQPVRAMYRSIGIDPTRTRPSSEALLRRVRKGDPLPRISTLVDVVNWCSLERQLPYGLYDLARVEPPVDLRLGLDGEEYEGIRKDVVHVQGRMTLADRRGAFGNPTSDSARTMVTAATTEALCVVFAPASVGAGDLGQVLDLTAGRFSAFTGARELERAII